VGAGLRGSSASSASTIPVAKNQIPFTPVRDRCIVNEAIPRRMAFAGYHVPVTLESSGFPSEVWSLWRRKAGLLPESVNDTRVAAIGEQIADRPAVPDDGDIGTLFAD
jgi:hypothetical protein